MNCKVCGNTSTKNTTVSFFRFPKQNSRCRDWAERCDLMKSYSEHGTLQFYKSFRICSDHFDPKDILFDGRKKRLLQTAVPQFFLRQKPIIASPKKAIHDINSNNMFKFKLVQNLCRLCAKENRNLTDIFEGQGKTLNLEKKLKYFPLVVNKYDVLPLRVCHRCILKVNQFCEFIKSCIRAESKLKDLLEIENCEKNYKIIDTGCDLTENLLQKLTEGSLQKTPNFTPESSISTTVQTPEPVVNKILDSNLSDSKTLKFSNKPNDNEIEILFNEKSQNNYAFNEVSQCSKIKELNFDKNIKIEKRYSKLLLMDQSSSDTKIKTETQDQNFITETMHSYNMSLKTFTAVEALDSNFVPKTHEKVFKRYCLQEHTHTLINNEKPFKCQICFETFHQVALLKQHCLTHNSEKPENSFSNFRTYKNDREFWDTCLINYSYTDENNQQNKSLIHGKNKKNDKLNFLKINLKKKKNSKPRCRFCDNLFESCKLCRNHEVDVSHQCKECSKIFRSKSSLRQHKSVHSDKRLFSCNECGMSFKRKDTLSNHLRIHTGERPFVCKVCGFAFKQRGDCVKHEKNHLKNTNVEVHPKKEPSQCELETSLTSAELLTSNSQPEMLWNEEKYPSMTPNLNIVKIAPAQLLNDVRDAEIYLNNSL